VATGLTAPQRQQLLRAYRMPAHVYIRAEDHGQRVTLASLYYRNLMVRRAHSGAGTTSPAHEYQLASALRAAMDRKAAARRVTAAQQVDEDGFEPDPAYSTGWSS
jgi:hypothetical protein